MRMNDSEMSIKWNYHASLVNTGDISPEIEYIIVTEMPSSSAGIKAPTLS